MSPEVQVIRNTTKEEARILFFPYSGGVLTENVPQNVPQSLFLFIREPSSPSYEPYATATISDPSARNTQAYYWTSEWQEGEQEADEDIRLGNTVTFSDIEEAIAWLDADDD